MRTTPGVTSIGLTREKQVLGNEFLKNIAANYYYFFFLLNLPVMKLPHSVRPTANGTHLFKDTPGHLHTLTY